MSGCFCEMSMVNVMIVSECACGMSRFSERDGNILCQDVPVGCVFVNVMQVCLCDEYV